ncbi:chromosome partitioning protein (plasmid) [Rhodococcus sp. p52]|uniref:ParA family protein n=1 Tax=Rhodococcus sp. p52 TaxID=935199 RepID=UPI000519EC24|nr:ParA family protein [Rhodococcus sp. p52]AOD24728.1 chromosome partitioning protein [Rhodococcus sp. p52]
MITIAVLNLKGGSGKTTSAAFIAHALHEAGLRVLGVDADGENESLVQWQSLGDWPFPVVGMAQPNLHKNLPGVADDDRYDAVVIDTPPMKEARNIVLSAARVATHIVCPMAPTGMEHSRLPAVRELVADATDLRDGEKPVFVVLFTRTVANASSTEVYRDIVTEEGDYVLKVPVARKEQFAQAFGSPIENALSTAYGDAVTELLDLTIDQTGKVTSA